MIRWMDIESTRTKKYIDIMAELYKIELKNHNLYKGIPMHSSHRTRIFEYPWAVLNTDLKITDSVLDAGGGDGPFQFYLAKRCKAVINIDNSKGALDRAISTAQLFHYKMAFVHDNLINHSLTENFFDKIYCISSIEHNPSDQIIPCVEELNRLLKPDGTLIITLDVGNQNLNMEKAKEIVEYFNIKFIQPPPDAYEFRINDLTIKILCLKAKKVKG